MATNGFNQRGKVALKGGNQMRLVPVKADKVQLETIQRQCGYEPRKPLSFEHLSNLQYQQEFDTVAMVLLQADPIHQTTMNGSSYKTTSFFVADAHSDIRLNIQLRESNERVVQWDYVTPMKVFAFMNLVYVNYDAQNRIHTCYASESSLAISSYAPKEFKQVKVEFENPEKRLHFELLQKETEHMLLPREEEEKEQLSQMSQQDLNRHLVSIRVGDDYPLSVSLHGTDAEVRYTIPCSALTLPQQLVAQVNLAEASNVQMEELKMTWTLSVDNGTSVWPVKMDESHIRMILESIWNECEWLDVLVSQGRVECSTMEEEDESEELRNKRAQFVAHLETLRRKSFFKLLETSSSLAPNTRVMRMVLMYSCILPKELCNDVHFETRMRLPSHLAQASHPILYLTTEEWLYLCSRIEQSLAVSAVFRCELQEDQVTEISFVTAEDVREL